MSDLHLEGNMPLVIDNPEQADVLVLAGDICTPKSVGTLDRFFKQCSEAFDIVIYVTGNHELYRWETPNDKSHIAFIRKALAKYENIYVCENEVLNYKGLHIACATLWTDFSNGFLLPSAAHVMNDYRWGLTPSSVYDWHFESVKFLRESKADVVITHHAPLSASVHERFKGDMYNGLFHSNLDELVTELRPYLWIHGHMHNNAEYDFAATRVVCNPFGYGKENTAGFEYRKIIHVPTYR
jgi:Icc-related predicted phosphoesterase